MNEAHRKAIAWALNEVAALETVLSNLKDGLLEDLRTDAKEEAA